jgi:hypothetical protein
MVIHNVSVTTEEELNSTLLAKCTGFASELRGEQTLRPPYVNDSHGDCLGVLSLVTGLMVGSMVPLPNSPDRPTRCTLNYVRIVFILYQRQRGHL